MRAWVIVVVLVVVGIVAAWVGYWLGHAAGWTTNAEFPLQIGGGDRAILLSILLSFGSVMLGVWWLVARPLRRERRLLATGAPGHGRIVRVWRTGLLMDRGRRGREHQLAFELEMHPDGAPAYATRATRVATEDEEAILTSGTEVDVRYDPVHPASVAVVGPMATSMA
jgi:hypothetical protein